MSSVTKISHTPDPEQTMAYIARVSNPSNQSNEKVSRLLNYCINHKHWSVFESAYLTLEINTTIAISRQILRHRSFTFQEFSQRYSDVSNLTPNIEVPDLRRKDTKNRQNSILGNFENKPKLMLRTQELFEQSMKLYKDMINAGVASECARFVLPLASPSRLYMTGNCRQWIHYIQLREDNGTQLEHKEIAEQSKKIFIEVFPNVSNALGWR